MQSPWARDYKHIASIIVSAVLNVQPFLHSWLGILINITAWCQISLLSGYPRSAVLRAPHSAVPRIVSRTPWDVEATQAGTMHILYSLPSTRDTIFYRLRQWLQGHSLWSNSAYASWHVPHARPCSETCADWCYDFPILSAHTPRGDPSQPIPVGPPARGRGTLHFRYCHSTHELLMIYGTSRGQCLARASGAYRCIAPAYLSVSHPQVVFALHSL